MLTTTRRSIQYPDPARTDRPDIPLHMGYLAAAIDTSAIYNQGTDAARIAAAHVASGGRFWWTTDTLRMWYDDGATWRPVGVNEWDYVQITSAPTGISVTSEGAAATQITGNSVTFDGTKVRIEFFAPKITSSAAAAVTFVVVRDSAVVGQIWGGTVNTSSEDPYFSIFDTPSAAAHQYFIKAFVGSNTVTVNAGAGGSGNLVPAYMRITRA